MTCHHIIQEKFVEEKKVINLHYGKFNEEKILEIKLDINKRFIKYFDEPFDVTMIEILKEDNINKDKFLIPDWNYKNGYNSYLNDYFYLAGYLRNNEIRIFSGKINKYIRKA